jgi:hypothetical protein
MLSAEFICLEARFFNQVPENRRLPVNKFRAQFDNFLADTATENSAAHTIPRFHYLHTQTCGCQLSRRSQACDSSAQHDDVMG